MRLGGAASDRLLVAHTSQCSWRNSQLLLKLFCVSIEQQIFLWKAQHNRKSKEAMMAESPRHRQTFLHDVRLRHYVHPHGIWPFQSTVRYWLGRVPGFLPEVWTIKFQNASVSCTESCGLVWHECESGQAMRFVVWKEWIVLVCICLYHSLTCTIGFVKWTNFKAKESSIIESNIRIQSCDILS